jgi:PAS domain S-box-containing protein
VVRSHIANSSGWTVADHGTNDLLNQPFGQALTDENGRFIQVNRTLCRMLDFEAQALLARTVRDITHPDDWPGNLPLLERLCRDDEPFTIVKRCLRADGSAVWVQSYVSMLRDIQGQRTISALIRPVLPAEDEARRWGRVVPAVPWNRGPERMTQPRRGLPAGRLLH